MIYNNKCSKLDTENWETEPGGGWRLLWMELSERAAEKGMLSEDPTEQSQECRDGCAEHLERGDSKPEGPKVGTNLACPKTKASPFDCLTIVTVVIKHPADVK